jgi:hypothetical protein
VRIPIASITINESEQVRAVGTDEEVAADYAEALGRGCVLPPVVVFDDGDKRYLADGFHTYEAHVLAGRSKIEAEVRKGTRRDALYFSCGANANHGKRRTNLDKRSVVEIMLRDPEWSKMSDNAIGKHCSVDHKTVAKLRSELTSDLGFPKSEVSSDRDGRTIDTSNIGRAKQPDRAELTVRREQSAMRTGRDGRTINTANIGRGRQPDDAVANGATLPTLDEVLVYRCEVCGERLDVPAWHCQACGKHVQAAEKFCPECESPRPVVTAVPAPSGVNDDQGGDVPAADPGPVDEVGLPLMGDSAAAFAFRDKAEEALKLYRQLSRVIDELAAMPGGEWYRQRLQLERHGGVDRFHCPDLHNSRRELEWSKPYASVCPACSATDARLPSCPICRGLPYVVKEMWDRCPPEQREALFLKLLK